MGIEEGDGDLKDQLAAIESALASSKVDPYIAHEFAQRKDDPDFNAGEFLVAMLARVSDPTFRIEGVRILSGIGNILAMQAPFTSFPDLVAEKKVIYLEASRPAGLAE